MKNSTRCMVGAALFILCFAATEISAQTPDPVNGTWELNLAKSKYASGPAPKSETRMIEVVGDRITYTSRRVEAEGKAVVTQFVANFDGKEYPLKGNPNYDAISLKRIDRFTTESLNLKAGKVIFRNRRVVSADGKVMTVTGQTTNAKGEAVTDVVVFDKK